jgi:hypothetical protein
LPYFEVNSPTPYNRRLTPWMQRKFLAHFHIPSLICRPSIDIKILTRKCNYLTKSSFGIITKTLFTFMSDIHMSQVKTTIIQLIVRKFYGCPQLLLRSPRNLSQTGPHTSWANLSYLGSGTFKYPALDSRAIVVPKAVAYP